MIPLMLETLVHDHDAIAADFRQNLMIEGSDVVRLLLHLILWYDTCSRIFA